MPVKTYTLKVAEIRKETNDTSTICFKQPGLKKVYYTAGQYLTLLFRINGRRYTRPYSFSSSPGIDLYLEITVKRVPGGVVSNHIIDQVAVGDVIEVMPPMGDFVIPENAAQNHIVLWGVGSGITPLYSIAKSVLLNRDDQHVTLVYGNRHHDSVIFGDNIQQLQKSHPTRFSVWNFHTQLVVDANNPYLIQGRISPSKVLKVMQQEGDLKNTLHFICGPAGLKESVKSELLGLGVNPTQVFSEDFELVKDPADFIDIITRLVEIRNDGNLSTVEVAKGKSILEACLDAEIDLAYSCQTGNCKVCKGSVKSGAVKMIGLSERPEHLDENDYLLCCTYPLTDGILIEV